MYKEANFPGFAFLSTLSLRRATQTARRAVSTNAISIHALLAESDERSLATLIAFSISIHALLAESDRHYLVGLCRTLDFYPRSPCGERQPLQPSGQYDGLISIHALLAESDSRSRSGRTSTTGFLSTLSLRRATALYGVFTLQQDDFYPRSPCGERHNKKSDHLLPTSISIHALLAESDMGLDGRFKL